MRQSRAVMVAAALLLGGACGNDTGGGPDDAAAEALELVAADFSFEPESFSVPAGAAVTLDVTNEGDALHSFTAEDVDADVDIPAGASETASFEMPDTGTVSFRCKYHPTTMQGQISVEGAAGDEVEESPAPGGGGGTGDGSDTGYDY